jgi:hypothetical protein
MPGLFSPLVCVAIEETRYVHSNEGAAKRAPSSGSLLAPFSRWFEACGRSLGLIRRDVDETDVAKPSAHSSPIKP